MHNSYSIWVKLDRYPPVVVRLLARKGNRLMTDKEIIDASLSLTLADVKRLSYLPTWAPVSVAVMREFCTACGVDFADRKQMRSLNRYLKNDPKFEHVKRESNFEQYKEMLDTYLDYEINRS